MPRRKIRGSFCEEKLAPKSAFDRRSYRWKRSGRAWVLVGCPKGKFRADRCSVGMRAKTLLRPAKGRCSVGTKRLQKG